MEQAKYLDPPSHTQSNPQESVEKEPDKFRMSKRQRMKLEKLSKLDQELFIDEYKMKREENIEDKVQKASKIDTSRADSFLETSKKSKDYMEYLPNEDTRGKLWGREERFNLDDLSMNLGADDLQTKRREMKWDPKKKKYVQMLIGKDGKAVKEKNEAGKIIDKTKKKPDIYKKWMQRTHLRV